MNTIVTLRLQADLRYLRIASIMASNVAEIFAVVACTEGNVAEFCHAYELSVSEAPGIPLFDRRATKNTYRVLSLPQFCMLSLQSEKPSMTI